MNSVSPGTEFEPCHLPIGFGLFDAVFARRYEIPPDVPRAIHGLASERHEAGVRACPDGDAVSGPKHEQLRGSEDIACNLDLTGDRIDGSLIVTWIERHRCTSAKTNVRIEHWARRFHRGGCSEQRSRDDAHNLVRFFQYREIIGVVVDESGFGLFVLGRQCYPTLNAEQFRADRAQLRRECVPNARYRALPSSS